MRKVAYEVLSEKIHIKALSIALRLQLVNEGLSDRSGNMSFVVVFVFYVPPTAKVIWRRGHVLKSHLTDW